MVLYNVLREIEPEFRHLRQNGSLLGDDVVENYIEAADAVRCNKNHVLADIINFSYFAFLDGKILFHFVLL